jgi:DNA-binding NtrC family response regulator
MKSILVISNEMEALQTIEVCFSEVAQVERAIEKESVTEMLRAKRFDLLFIDVRFLTALGSNSELRATLQSYWQIYPTLEIIVMATPDMIREAVKAVKAGASNYLTYPIQLEEVKYVADEARDSAIVHSELDYLRDQFWQLDSHDIIHTNSPLMASVYSKIRSVAPTKSTVLLMGDTGTGKSLLATLIHRHSNRREAQFISVHCGAIPDTLIESELFGHEKGAFTGAHRRKLGKFEIAHGGTIFLDEIGTITPAAQIKLLQVLQDGTFQRVGGDYTIESNVRVITATNVDLNLMCKNGDFRKDLYYRLNVFPVEIPPLRDRVQDIEHLVDGFLNKLNRHNTKEIHGVDPLVIEAFKQYSWPGNIRELENLIERAFILENSNLLTPDSFPSDMFNFKISSRSTRGRADMTLSEARRQAVESAEMNYLVNQLALHQGKIKATAEKAGVTTRQLHKLMSKYGIRKEDFKAPPKSNP